MQTNIKSILTLLFAGVLSFSACKKDSNLTPTPQPDKKSGNVNIGFSNKIDGADMILSTQWYQNANGDSFTVSKLNYYISNIKLIGAEGTTDFSEPESYHLIEQSTARTELSLQIGAVPGGSYKAVQFMIGVDSLRNVSGAQSGALDPGLGNFWSWSSGYIMLKFEGTAPKSPSTGNMLMFHVGGFSGANNTLRTVTLNFPKNMEINGNTATIAMAADVLQLFRSPNLIDFSKTTIIHMPGAVAKMMADNYATMFSLSSVQ